MTRFANVRDDTSSEDPLYIRTHHREPVRVHRTIHVNGKLPANRPKGARPRSMTRDSALKNSRKVLLAFAADECTQGGVMAGNMNGISSHLAHVPK